MLVTSYQMHKDTIASAIFVVVKSNRCIGNSCHLMACHIGLKNMRKKSASIFINRKITIITIGIP